MSWSWPLPNCVPWEIPQDNTPGTGIDLFAPMDQPVHAVEDGIIRSICLSTGASVGSPWREETSAVLIEGKTGLITYGGILPTESISVSEGRKVRKGQLLGHVFPVSSDDKDNGVSMLHLEVHKNSEAPLKAPVNWPRDTPDPAGFLHDPTEHLIRAWAKVSPRFHREGEKPPNTKEGKRNLIKWLQKHPLWSHPRTIKVPPDGNWMEPAPNGPEGCLQFRDHQDDWKEVVTQVNGLEDCISFDFVYVDPTEERIQDGPDFRNTDFRVWIEAGGWVKRRQEDFPDCIQIGPDEWDSVHDLDLDCGAAQLEDAFVELALRVKFFYNDDGTGKENAPTQCDGELDEDENYTQGCHDAGDGFCHICGFKITHYEQEENDES